MKKNNPSDRAKQLFLATKSIIIFSALIVLHGCEETMYTPKNENGITAQRIRPRPGNPPPPAPFYFTNCGVHVYAITGTVAAGIPTTATATLTYINSPGGSYPAFTSNTVNGVRLSAPAGTLSVGSGSITFTASGTPVSPGDITIPFSIGGSLACYLPITVSNAPSSGNCTEPGAAIGSTGCVTFAYRGQTVNYSTVRAADGKIWLQQNLGSPQVAVNKDDITSFGHYFQWGRWDDGHQVPDGAAVTGGSSLQNPSHIASGNPAFIKGSTAIYNGGLWWAMGGAATDTWSGTIATATNGKSPCEAIGPGWRLPTASEWRNLLNTEYISDALSAFDSHLKLTESGYRASGNGKWTPRWVGGIYWTSTAGNNNVASALFFDTAYNVSIRETERGFGHNCRCVKN